MKQIVATSISLADLKIGFLSCANFMSLACWSKLTHLIIEDFLNIQIADGRVRVAGEADRFGWREYKKILNELAKRWPQLTLLLEFHEIIGRDLLYGKLKFPCCDIEEFVKLNFPESNVGLSLRVLFGMSVMNLDRGLGNALQCFRQQNDRQIWLNIDNKHFVLNRDDAIIFDGIFRFRQGSMHQLEHKTVLKMPTERDEQEARIAYHDYAGMMTKPLFRDKTDALFMLPGGSSQLSRCLEVWDRCGECPKCDVPDNICAAQCIAPGSCSRRTEQNDQDESVLIDGSRGCPEPLGQLFLMDDLE